MIDSHGQKSQLPEAEHHGPLQSALSVLQAPGANGLSYRTNRFCLSRRWPSWWTWHRSGRGGEGPPDRRVSLSPARDFIPFHGAPACQVSRSGSAHHHQRNPAQAGRVGRIASEAGISCLNISLDTLQAQKIRGNHQDRRLRSAVRAGIDACLKGGLRVKVNVVALKGINDDELARVRGFRPRTHGVDVRFIEFMPIGYQSRWSRDNYWPAEEIIAEVEKLVPLEEVLEASRNSGPAQGCTGISGGSGPNRGHFGGQQSFLRELQPLSGHFRRQAAHLSVFRPGI